MKASLKLIFGIVFYIISCSNLYAQNKKRFIEFRLDTSLNADLTNTKISFTQKGYLHKVRLNEKIAVDTGVNCIIEFNHPGFIIPGIKSLKIYSDTLIFIGYKNLESVVVQSRKTIVRQTLKGFEYSPQNDSVFKNRSLLVSMQRLPFIILKGEDAIEYTRGKIMFKINGREKKGIGNSWNSVLNAINAKDIYKVEMITEVPAFVKNQGYDVIIDILTLDANLYGKTFTAATFFNTRNNINPSTSFTLQHKKADFSISANNNNDRQTNFLQAKVMENENIISENRINTNFRFHGYSLNLGYGLRVDSANDLSVNLSMHRYKNISAFQNEYAYPTPVNNQNDEHINSGGEINLSYIHRKSKFITKSIVAKAKIENIEYNNRLAYMQPVKNDSISRQFQTKPMNWIVEYNYLNTQHETYNIEYGLQFYQKDYSQSYYIYTLNNITNENFYLIDAQEDSMRLTQYAIRPYFKYDKDFTPKKNLILNLSSEWYSILPKNFKRKNYYLPDIDVSYKTLFDNNASLTYSISFNYSKPSEDYFTGQQYYNNPAEAHRGSADLAPGKTIGAGVEYLLVNKSTFSSELNCWHSFDDPTFFTAYDSINKLMVTSPNNGYKSYGIGYNLNFQKLIAKKLNLSFYSSIIYQKIINKSIHTSSSGLRFRIQPTITYFLGRKYGNLNFWGIIEGNNVTSQGKTTGPLRYSLSYAKSIIQRKFTVVFILDEFLVKNREKKTYSVFNGLSQYSNIIRPSRLISIRFAYYFSNIRLSKFAKMKSASIKGERKAD